MKNQSDYIAGKKYDNSAHSPVKTLADLPTFSGISQAFSFTCFVEHHMVFANWRHNPKKVLFIFFPYGFCHRNRINKIHHLGFT
jgi:hypothetical protein